MRNDAHFYSRPALRWRSAADALTRARTGLRSRPALWLIPLGEFVFFLIVAVAVLWPAPLHAGELPAAFAQSDVMISHWPSALLIKRTISLEHRLPLWNPFYGGGRPLAADPLAAMFYPATQLVNLFPIRDYYLILMLGHIMLAGFGTLLLARYVLRLSRWPSLVAAVSYMATPRLLGHLGAGHVTLIQTVAWYPWLALGAWGTIHYPRRWAAPFALILGLTLLAGHPQMAYYGLMMTGAVALWLLWTRYRSGGIRALRGALAGLVVAGVTGLMLASVHLLPLAQFTGLSTRQDSVAATDRYPLLAFIRALLGRPLPSSVPWENIIDPGGVVLMLAILGIIAAGRRALPLFGGILLVAALAMGNASPIFTVASHLLPGFNRFHGLSRIWFLGLLGIALLAGFGAQALLGLVHSLDDRLVRRGHLALGLAVLLIVTGTLVKSDQGLAKVGPVSPPTTPTQLEQTVSQLAGSSRVYGVQRNLAQLSAVTLNTRFADGWDPLLIESYVHFMQQAGGYDNTGYQLTIPSGDSHPNARLLGLMNVGIVVSKTNLKDPGFKLIETLGDTHIYRNTLNAGPGYLVNPGRDGQTPDLASLQVQSGGVTPTRMSREEDDFRVSSAGPAYLVIADPVYPGWKATVDGKAVTMTAIGGALPAIKLTPGTHTIVYRYAPTTVYLGAVGSGAGILLLLVGFFFGLVYRGRLPTWG